MPYVIGDSVPLSVRVRDKNGDLADAGNVAVTVTLPDGTTAVTDPVTPTDTGVYDVDFPATQPGRHGVRWVASGANASAYADAFDVAPLDDMSFVSLAETKRYLRKDLAKTDDDDALQDFIAAACESIEIRIGTVTPRTVTYRPTRRSRTPATIVLPDSPVTGVMSVTVDGTDVPAATASVDGWGWELNGPAGLLTHNRWWPHGQVEIVYRTGEVTARIRLAAFELIAHLWRSSQLNTSPARPGLTGDDQIVVRGQAFAFPNRVRELLGLGAQLTNDVQVG